MKKWISLLLALALMLGVASAAAAEESSPLGVVEDSVYTNAFFGFQVELSESWWFLTDSQLAANMGYDSANASREGLLSLLKSQGAVCGMFAGSYVDAAASMNFMVEDLGTSQTISVDTYRMLSKGSLAGALEGQGFTNVTVEERTFLVSGQELLGFSVAGDIGDFTLHMVDVLIKVDRYMGVLTLAASSEEGISEAVGFLKLL